MEVYYLYYQDMVCEVPLKRAPAVGDHIAHSGTLYRVKACLFKRKDTTPILIAAVVCADNDPPNRDDLVVSGWFSASTLGIPEAFEDAIS